MMELTDIANKYGLDMILVELYFTPIGVNGFNGGMLFMETGKNSNSYYLLIKYD